MRVFLDANILFSAAKSDGAMRRLIKLLGAAGHQCCADGYVVEEARRNLAIKSPDAVGVLESLLRRIDVADAHPGDRELEASLLLPEKDRPVLAAAIHHGCDALVTGDHTHFGKLYGKTIRGVKICSPASLAEELL